MQVAEADQHRCVLSRDVPVCEVGHSVHPGSCRLLAGALHVLVGSGHLGPLPAATLQQDRGGGGDARRRKCMGSERSDVLATALSAVLHTY